MTLLHYAGAALVLFCITALGLYSGSKVRTAADFAAGGGKASSGLVAGTILGTLVGGASTIGTAQLAFTYGLSAWWFSLGGGIACLILGLVYAKPMYESGCSTMPQMVAREYGQKAATTTAILSSLGNFIAIISQILSCVALAASFSALPAPAVTVLVIGMVLAYVIFGGVWGTGIVGVAKIILTAGSIGLCGFAALYWQGGPGAFMEALPRDQYFNLMVRGFSKDIGAAFSMLLGVVSTQTYVQAVVSARSLPVARTGAVVSALLVPLIGAGGIFVGMYMRIHFPDIAPATALPRFVLEFVPPLFAGVVLATLLITAVGTAAGLSLGVSTILCNDIYCVYGNPRATDGRKLRVSRLILAGVLVIAGLISLLNIGSLILEWSYLSMALRGVAGSGILTAALFLRGRFSSGTAITAMLAGVICVIAGQPLFGQVLNPLFPGAVVTVLIFLAGYGRRKAPRSP